MTASDPVALCLAGQLPPGVALARLVLADLPPEAIAARLPEGSVIAALFAAQRDNLEAVAAMLRESGVRHDAPPVGDAVAAIAAVFDRAVALQPEASVAAYSLGDPALLAAATDELVDWLCLRGVAGREADVVDLGCGIGRVAAALAPRVGSVLGLDVSAGMVAEACRRHAAPNLRFALTDGRRLGEGASGSIDLVLAVDSFPYLVQAGIAEAHIAAAAHLLRPGGHLVVLNLSYRGDDARDAADFRAWAAISGLQVVLCGTRPFRTWDGAAYALRRTP